MEFFERKYEKQSTHPDERLYEPAAVGSVSHGGKPLDGTVTHEIITIDRHLVAKVHPAHRFHGNHAVAMTPDPVGNLKKYCF